MAIDLPALLKAFKIVPSASNSAGTALGTIAAGILNGYMMGALWVPPLAAAVSMTPAGFTSLAVLGTGMAIGYLVTHVAEVHNLNDLVAKWWPQSQQSFPAGKNGETDDVQQPVSSAPASVNFNQPVESSILPANIASHTITPTPRA